MPLFLANVIAATIIFLASALLGIGATFMIVGIIIRIAS